MKLTIKAVVLNDEGTEIVTEEVSYAGNASGLVHAVKPLGESLTYGISLGLFLEKKIPVKDTLGNTRKIAGDVIELVAPEPK